MLLNPSDELWSDFSSPAITPSKYYADNASDMGGSVYSDKEADDLEPMETIHNGDVETRRGSLVDAVFGQINEDGPNYRSVGWIATAILMMKTQIGLGVLSIPAVFDTLGIVPGMILLITIAVITTWSDYIIGVFKLRHRTVYGIDDAGFLMFGKVGREFFGAAFVLFWIFVAGSGMLGISIGLNTISSHAACTAAFVGVAASIGLILGSIQTLGKISGLAWVGLVCILTAILTVTIAVGVQDRPAAAPQVGDFQSDYKIFNNPSFVDAVSAVSSLIFAFSGTPAFFSIVAEMRDPRQYNKALITCQSVVTGTYITIGCVVYYFCGSYVSSPALGSAGDTVKKIAYGFALPGLIVTTTLTIHLPAKYLFVRFLRGSKHLTNNSFKHWCTWLGCTVSVTLIAYVIASAVPVFGGLVSLVGALLGTLMSFQPMGCMWFYDNWKTPKNGRNWKWIFMVCFAGFVIVSGTFMTIAGTYGSIVGIMDSYKHSGGSGAWSCADNSNSTAGGH